RAEQHLARPREALLGERDVAHALVARRVHVEEVGQRLLAGEVAQDVDVAVRLVVAGEDVVIGDQDDALGVPDAGGPAELALEDTDRPRAADVVGHEDVGADPDVLARLDRRLPGGARQDLLGHGHGTHGPTSACWRWARYWRRYSSLLSAFT